LNRAAELGVGTHMPTDYPTSVLTNERFEEIAAAGWVRTWDGGVNVEFSASCGRRADGAVFCWGDNMQSAMADSISAKQAQVPQRVVGVPPVTRLFGGATTICGLTTGAELYCWGGYFGNPGARPRRVNLSNVIDAEQGEWHSCALTQDGRWHCWGFSDQYGERGDSTATQRFRKIAVGQFFTCGLDDTGSAWCWGRNNVGQLGRGTLTPECWDASGQYPRMCPGTDVSPKPVFGGRQYVDIDAGQSHVCAIEAGGTIHCWGRGTEGQLGDGRGDHAYMPVVVGSQLRFSSMSVGDLHTCGVALDGKAYCWGQGVYGQLGTQSTVSYKSPVLVSPQ
jgi:alpha-tubulin suppressor-like RCC1 family protein